MFYIFSLSSFFEVFQKLWISKSKGLKFPIVLSEDC